VILVLMAYRYYKHHLTVPTLEESLLSENNDKTPEPDLNFEDWQ
jgi:hypothetical protein